MTAKSKKGVFTMKQLNVEEIDNVSGGSFIRFMGPLGAYVAVADALYEVYQGFSDHRK